MCSRPTVVDDLIPVSNFHIRLRDQICFGLKSLSILKDGIEERLSEMSDKPAAMTNNKSITTSLQKVKYKIMRLHRTSEIRLRDTLSMSLKLSRFPSKQLSNFYPADAARTYFGLTPPIWKTILELFPSPKLDLIQA